MNAPEKPSGLVADDSASSGVPSAQRRKKKAPQTPYLAGRKEWNAQFGSVVADRNNWRLMAIFSGLIAAVSVIGLVTLGARTKTVPFVSVLDTSGRIINQGLGTGTTFDDPRVLNAMIARFITNFRFVSTDGAVQQKAIKDLFTMLSTGDPAFKIIADYFQADGDPFDKAKTQTVSIEISAILPLSPTTYQAEWREITRDRRGAVMSTIVFQSQLTVRRQSDMKADVNPANPIGLYVTDISWTKKL